MIGIYKITSPNKKVYIGQSLDIYYRFKVYQKLKCKQQIRLYASFLKYGVKKHIFEIICECAIEELNEKERYYQELFQVTSKKGLNCILTSTKESKSIVSKETRLKMSNSAKNRTKKIKLPKTKKKRTYSDEQKLRMSQNHTKYWLGKKRSEEDKLKMSLKKIGTKQSQEAKNKRSKVVLDLLCGVYYNSAREVSDLYKIPYSTIKNKLCGNYTNNTPFVYV